jgi:hypothetical protein
MVALVPLVLMDPLVLLVLTEVQGRLVFMEQQVLLVLTGLLELQDLMGLQVQLV